MFTVCFWVVFFFGGGGGCVYECMYVCSIYWPRVSGVANTCHFLSFALSSST